MLGNIRHAGNKAFARFWRLPLVAFGALWLFQPLASSASQEDRGWRWFEVEILVFRHNQSNTADAEQFPLQITPFNAAASRDLISSRFGQIDLRGYINALPRCSGDDALLPVVQQRLQQASIVPATRKENGTSTLGCKRLPHLALVPAWHAPHGELYDHQMSQIPQVITGHKTGTREELLAADIPFTVHPSNFRFQQLRQQFERRSDTEVLLHTAWQQPVFNRNRGRKMRIVGGRNLSNEFNFMGFAKPQRDMEDKLPDLFNRRYERNQPTVTGVPSGNQQPESEKLFNNMRRLFTAIDSNQFAFADYGQPDNLGLNRPQTLPAGTPEQVWELDGLLEIYLIGNFLHIAPELNLREVITLNPTSRSPEQQVDDFLNDNDNSLQFLRNYPLAQLRRVISHQLHYFDHPNYGMVIEIRRTDLSARR